MNRARFREITEAYSRLRVVVLGDFCLDRYLEIDPQKNEISIETGLPVYNVTRVRAQPGGAGTVLNNLHSLGAGTIWPIGFGGDDGEGYELTRELGRIPGVKTDYFLKTRDRATFTYCKPLLVGGQAPPRELNRLDTKNWSPTPGEISKQIRSSWDLVSGTADLFVILSQVDIPGTGVVTPPVMERVRESSEANPQKVMIADSRHGLSGFPPLLFKMNLAELGTLTGRKPNDLKDVASALVQVAQRNQRPAVVTLAERGIVGASPDGSWQHRHSLPIRGEIDIVGAGDAVTANLGMALAAGASLDEAMEISMAAASCVIHQLGTTGTASRSQIEALLFDS